MIARLAAPLCLASMIALCAACNDQSGPTSPGTSAANLGASAPGANGSGPASGNGTSDNGVVSVVPTVTDGAVGLVGDTLVTTGTATSDTGSGIGQPLGPPIVAVGDTTTNLGHGVNNIADGRGGSSHARGLLKSVTASLHRETAAGVGVGAVALTPVANVAAGATAGAAVTPLLGILH
ncbi:MAG: hypothetical protein KF889_18260 [Alphaproteobacteria bacterium]|nr:hypothetical protein [Alphaproteobacteria bacterium]MCW5743988.1 hypothetical protein [Alphaproteobacteria bacterium]